MGERVVRIPFCDLCKKEEGDASLAAYEIRVEDRTYVGDLCDEDARRLEEILGSFKQLPARRTPRRFKDSLVNSLSEIPRDAEPGSKP